MATPRATVQMRRANAARSRALRRLMQLHREEFHALYTEEAEKLGVRPRPYTGTGWDPDRHKDYFDGVRESGVTEGVDPGPLPRSRFALPSLSTSAIIRPEQQLTRDEIMRSRLDRGVGLVPEMPGASESEKAPPAPPSAALPEIPDAPF